MAQSSQTPPQLGSTWTAYATLLSSLEAGQQAALEEASCAHYCGRYRDVEKFFNENLPKASTVPILALQRADALTSQGFERDRVQLLEKALQDLSLPDSTDGSIRLLLEFMLADARFWAFGEMQGAVNLLPRVREHLRSRGLQNLRDIEIRCFTLYYDIVGTFKGSSNYIGQSDETIFENSKGDKRAETRALRQILESQSQWRFAPTLMSLELKYTPPGPELGVAVNAALTLCNTLQQYGLPPLWFRAIVLKKQVSAIVSTVMPPFGLELQKQYVEMTRRLTSPSYTEWETLCPNFALGIAKAEILDGQFTPLEKLDQLQRILHQAEERNDYTKMNQLYISLHDVAQDWLRKASGTDSADIALQRLRQNQELYMEFHRTRTREAFWEAAALGDYLSTLLIRDRNYSKIISLVDAFQKHHPTFAVPRAQERQYDMAMKAASRLDLQQRRKQFAKEYRVWLKRCSFWKSGALAGEGLSESEFVSRNIIVDGEDMVEWGVNAVRVMLGWAANEWEQGLLSTDDCHQLFGAGLDDAPSSGLGEYLKEVDAEFISDGIFGKQKEPTESAVFLGMYSRLRDWILRTDRQPSRAARLVALKVFLQSRLFRFRQYFILTGIPKVSLLIAEEDESKELSELQRLEKAEGDEIVDTEEMDLWAAIHATLGKCHSDEAVSTGRIDDEDLSLSTTDCQTLITRLRNNGNQIAEYRAIIQLISLTWQRFLRFKTRQPSDVMNLIQQAETIFNQIRSKVMGLDPSEGLLARAKLAREFSHREHYNFAFAAGLAALESSSTESGNRPSDYFEDYGDLEYSALLRWAILSKGRGFADVLSLASTVPPSIQESESKEDLQPPQRVHDSKIDVAGDPPDRIEALQSSLEATHVSSSQAPSNFDLVVPSADQFQEMLSKLPRKVVLVDFIDVRYAQRGSIIVAMIHRAGQKSSLVKIHPSMNMGKIELWVRENLDSVKGQKKTQFREASSMEALGGLSNLLKPLISTESKVLPKPGETVVICPTGSLNRVPIHAIPIDGIPFIERNPVVYCQSWTTLHWLWTKFRDQRSTSPAKCTVINPMPDKWPDGEPVTSHKQVTMIAENLKADHHAGFELRRTEVLDAIKEASIFHYHGHVVFNPRSALDSVLVLNQQAYESKSAAATTAIANIEGYEVLSARALFDAQLGTRSKDNNEAAPALITLVGCGSGVATISSTDDMLGLPTALFYAGAGSVVSTLWPILDADGAAFGLAFYTAIAAQRRQRRGNLASATTNEQEQGFFTQAVDVAQAMQTAVKQLRSDPDRRHLGAPYHWAAFTLNGLWELPDSIFPTLK